MVLHDHTHSFIILVQKDYILIASGRCFVANFTNVINDSNFSDHFVVTPSILKICVF